MTSGWMTSNWGYVVIGCAPWIGAWLLYLLYGHYRRPGEELRDARRDAAGNATRHLAWLVSLRADQADAERLAASACAGAEAAVRAAQDLAPGDVALARALARAADEAEAAAAAATAAEISGRQLPEGGSGVAAAFAERATRAAAGLAARVAEQTAAAAPDHHGL